jgi:hypothetical protein
VAQYDLVISFPTEENPSGSQSLASTYHAVI